MFTKLVLGAILMTVLVVPAALASDRQRGPDCDVIWTRPFGCNDQHLFPRAADVSRARLLKFPGVPSWAPAIYVAPAGNRGGMCFSSIEKPYQLTDEWEIVRDRDEALQNVFSGCERNAGASWGWTLSQSIYPYAFYGPPDRTRAGVWLVSTVEAKIAKVKLVFQDGRTVTTRPQARVVAYVIPQRHWQAGHRLVRAFLYDAKGREVRQARWNPRLQGPPPRAGS